MLELDANLPAGALCDVAPEAASAALAGGVWWHGAPDTLEVAPKSGAVTLWRSLSGGPPAEPTEPNAGTGQIGQAGDLIGLQCRARTHCGMVAEQVTDDAATATMAIRFYTPPGEDARTLLTLNAAGAGNYVFVSEAAGTLTAKDDNDLVSVDLPCPERDTPRLAIVSVRGDRLALALGRIRADGTAPRAILHGPASLYLGCRNQRPGLLKTLGGALILDVWLFAGRALLLSDAPRDRAALAGLRRHHLWAAS